MADTILTNVLLLKLVQNSGSSGDTVGIKLVHSNTVI